ncbi:hypothetical protein M9H77_00841 [Catharanthus roseus]|uniref:Uncharacterized protein n=1 Tax=Catharanthus roseus TaxID=4058 RepID=A0ACC0C3Z2_CATRO|nr:hypothetical protein M9H77_00841 [Catharanthus roseus]
MDDVEVSEASPPPFPATQSPTNNNYPILNVLEALKEASHQLQTNSSSSSDLDSAIKVLLELETESNSILSVDPHLSILSSHLADLKVLVQTQEESKSKHRIRSFLSNRVRAHEISRVSSLIESEIQAWIDRETTNELGKKLEEWSNNRTDSSSSSDEEILLAKLSQFRDRLHMGFDIQLQEMLLKSRIYSLLESLLCNSSISKSVREMAAYTLKELILFNKDVFVGQVLGGQTIKALVTMGSFCGLEVLKSLIKAIKSPLVDELESSGGIVKIVDTLDSTDLALKIMALDCIMEIGYYGRKEAIEAMLNAGLIKKLVDLQRSELGGELIDAGKSQSEECGAEIEGREVYLGMFETRGSKEKRFMESHPFTSCVAKFAVQLEVGEGLRQREKRAFKQEILKRVREASVSDAEAATIVAEVLWGSSP